MNNIKSVKDFDLKNKRILLRVDFNVTLKGNKVGDDERIKQAIPTIKYILSKQASVILITHLGRPKGKRISKLSVAPVAKRLQKLINKPVRLIDDFTDNAQRKSILNMKPGELVLLENIRFFPQEEQNNVNFAKKLANLADIYINDSFGTNHRVHASTVGVASHIPKAAGFLLQKEIEMITRLFQKPKRPFVAIIGGAKAETKITLIERLLEMADQLLIGGGVANTFFKAWGFEVGKSTIEYEMVELARSLFWKASESNTAMVLPKDVVIGNLRSNRVFKVVAKHKIPKTSYALDIGPHTQAEFGSIISKARTIVWNGPMGVYENPKFQVGTDFVYHAIAANKETFSVVGGGDTLAALQHKHLLKNITHISTGGGALLQFIEKGTLPAIDSLQS